MRMEHYYLLIVICCFLPFILGGIWFARHDCSKIPREIKKSATSPRAEDEMLKEYYYDEFSTHYNGLLSKLKKVNLYDPRIRIADEMDVWFKTMTRELMHDGNCLAYINHYGHLEDTFWKNIQELNISPEQDEKFQRLIVSVYKTDWGVWIRNFCNLPFNYGQRYKLSPNVEKILNNDSRFQDVKQTYELARGYAERENLKNQ